MHYFQFNIGDYISHTHHLSPMEDLVYRRLIDFYYLSEKPLLNNTNLLGRKIKLSTNLEEIEAVLEEFFALDGDSWIHPRIEQEIEKYKEKSEKARESANARWKGNSNNANALRTKCDSNANQEPITNKHKPLVISVFDFWKTVMGSPSSRLTKDRITKIEARIKEGYSLEEMKRAVSGCAASKYHMGENPQGKKYNSIELIFRNGDKLEGFMQGGESEKEILY